MEHPINDSSDHHSPSTTLVPDICSKIEDIVAKQEETEYEEECMESKFTIETLKGEDTLQIKPDYIDIKSQENHSSSSISISELCTEAEENIKQENNEYEDECMESKFKLEPLNEDDEYGIKTECMDIKQEEDIQSEMIHRSSPTHETIYEPHKCPYCEYKIKYNRSLKNHIARRHKSMWFDPEEKKKINQIFSLKHKCDECTYEARYRSQLKQHQIKHKDPSQVAMYKCDKCSYETKFRNKLKVHQWKHKDPSQVQTYKCDKCSYEYKYRENLKRHQLRHKDPSQVQMYKCDQCSYDNNCRSLLKKHQLKHKDPSEVKLFKCDKCSFESRYSQSLKKHQLKHKDSLEERMYKSDECSENRNKYTLINDRSNHKDPAQKSTIMDERHSNLLTTESTSESDFEIGVPDEVHTVLENRSDINTRNANNETDSKSENNDRDEKTLERKRKNAEYCRQYRAKRKQLLDTKKNVDGDRETHRRKLAAIRAKNYRERNTVQKINHNAHNDSQAAELASKDVPRAKKNIHCSQIAGPSHKQVPFIRKNPIHGSQIAGPSTNDVTRITTGECRSNYRNEAAAVPISNAEIERVENEGADMTSRESDYEDHDHESDYDNLDNNLDNHHSEDGENDINNVQIEQYQSSMQGNVYTSYNQHIFAHKEFLNKFINNPLGYPCDVCDRLWFKKDLKTVLNQNDTLNITLIRRIITVHKEKFAICSTCFRSIQKNHIPQLAIYNGFQYPRYPDDLRNHPLDLVTERLISPRIPFMQIRRLRNINGQYGIYGQVINVPVEVDNMIQKLPRDADDDYCINVHIKRKKIHKSSFVQGLVNKKVIKIWLKYLIQTPLYTTYNITIDDSFLNCSEDNDPDNEQFLHFDDDNEFVENIPIEESLVAQQQSLIWNEDFYLRIAPGEHNVPISLLFDEHAEELSFPGIYLGHFRKFREGVNVTPFMMATSELRRSDRRGVTPYHLLYMAMKIMRIRVKDSLTIAFKHVGKNTNITKEQIQSEDYIQGCIESNLAFLRSIPNSAWYWSEKKKDLFAMIRQLGKPTLFFTISANEIGWPNLLQLIYKLRNKKLISKKEAEELEYMQKSTLINEDAVTCALYFNKLVNVIMNILQSKRFSPFKKYRIRHYFKRIEFQHRGSPHAHIIAWCDNAPDDPLGKDYQQAIDLIDALISVSASEASGNIKLNTHKHTFTCYKKITSNRAQECRFEAPFMPCKKTAILIPMKDTEENFLILKKKYKEIRKNLEQDDYPDFDEFYTQNNIASDEEYLNILRAGIKRPRVFVKRQPSEKWHNPFNPFIFNVVKSNTDIQFITEEYSCAAYVVEYVNKTNRGVSNLQRKIIETMNENPEFDIIDITRSLSVNLLNNTEMTSQEAAWYLMREPMSKACTRIVYIPTVWPVERQRIKKTLKELSALEGESTDIWKENWFDKYERRPNELEDISFAQFVSQYYKNNKGIYVKRDEKKIIRYRNYDIGSDFNEYRREMVTLHVPFRNEEQDILADMKFLTIYEENEQIILQKRKEFEHNIDIEKTIQICRELCREETPCDDDEVQDVRGRFPEANPFETLYDNPNVDGNADLRLATLNKLGAIAKRKEKKRKRFTACTVLQLHAHGE